MRNGKKEEKNSEFHIPQSEITEPMLFPHNALPSRPQAFFPQKRRKVKGGTHFGIEKNGGRQLGFPHES
jgi:hypothetical protein